MKKNKKTISVYAVPQSPGGKVMRRILANDGSTAPIFDTLRVFGYN